jgi:hypothetical protein
MCFIASLEWGVPCDETFRAYSKSKRKNKDFKMRAVIIQN